MGNSDLRTLSQITEIEIERLEGSVVAVDAYNWLYKYMTTTVQFTNTEEYTTEEGVEVPVIHGGIRGMKRFFENDIIPVFVFDGGYHDKKQAELSERRQARQSAKENAERAKASGETIEAAKLESRSKSLSDEMVAATKEMLDALGVEYITAPQSGESQAAYMVSNTEAYTHVISDDYDSLLFASPQTVRNFTSSSRALENMSFDDTLEELDITHEQLVDVALLCGTDYNDGIDGYGPKTAVSVIKEHGDIETVLEDRSGEIEYVTTLRDIFLSPNVTDEYPVEPSTPEPDIDNARDVLINTWELPRDHVEGALEDIEENVTQTSIDEWV